MHYDGDRQDQQPGDGRLVFAEGFVYVEPDVDWVSSMIDSADTDDSLSQVSENGVEGERIGNYSEEMLGSLVFLVTVTEPVRHEPPVSTVSRIVDSTHSKEA